MSDEEPDSTGGGCGLVLLPLGAFLFIFGSLVGWPYDWLDEREAARANRRAPAACVCPPTEDEAE